jgi:flagellar biosynthetic protein FliR
MTLPDLPTFLLVLARLSGLVIAAPVFGHLLVPVRVRVGLALLLAAVLAPVAAAGAVVPDSLPAMVVALAVEFALGTMVGLVATLIFAGVQLGGQIAGIQMGLGLANLFDPQTQAQVTIVGEWAQLVALLLFLVLDVHHLVLGALIESFRTAPPGALAMTQVGLLAVVGLAGNVFTLGVRVAAPVLIALLLSNATLGVLARTVPQFNVFVIGFPVNIGVGLVMLGTALPFTYRLLTSRFADLAPTLGGLVRGLAHG